MLSVNVWCQTDIGLKRSNNEDSFLMDADLGLYMVADGMGGHSGGEIASAMAIQKVHQVIQESYEKESGVKIYDLLLRAYRVASEAIYNESLENPKLKGMGTTLIVSLVREEKIYFANVGDSRVYLVRDGGLWQMTEDHSLVNEQIKSGMIKNENEMQHSKNIITRSVGFERETYCDVIERKMVKGDKYIICTDGLTGMVRDLDIYNKVSNIESSLVVGELIEEAKRCGGLDNVTVMLIDVANKA